jgi:hypothetical protein
MRAGDDGIPQPFGASIMANAVCENGPKRILVDSAARSFSLSGRRIRHAAFETIE